MEFVDGVTLREKIHDERTELRKLLRFLQHAAEGLAQARSRNRPSRGVNLREVKSRSGGHLIGNELRAP